MTSLTCPICGATTINHVWRTLATIDSVTDLARHAAYVGHIDLEDHGWLRCPCGLRSGSAQAMAGHFRKIGLDDLRNHFLMHKISKL